MRKRKIAIIASLSLLGSMLFNGSAYSYTSLISANNSGVVANRQSYFNDISDNGRFIAFESQATNLATSSGDIYSYRVLVRDTKTGEIKNESISPTGEYFSECSSPSLSGDGRYLLFQSSNALYLRDREMGTTELVSKSSTNQLPNDSITRGSISKNGRYIVYNSKASNLVAGDNNFSWDTFVFDNATKQTKIVSVSSTGVIGNSNTNFDSPAISDTGIVVFHSLASNLVPKDTNGLLDTFVHDINTGITKRINLSPNGEQADNSSYNSTGISRDGKYIAFCSRATNLVEGDTNNVVDLFVYNAQENSIKRITVSKTGEQANKHSFKPVFSADGAFITYSSFASNLVEDDDNGVFDVFLYNQITGETELISRNNDGQIGNGMSDVSSISADARYIIFRSDATNMAENDNNGVPDIYVVDRGDSIAPNTEIKINGSGVKEWYKTDVEISLTPSDNTDGAGVAETVYSYDDETWYNYSEPFIITREGVTELKFKSRDNSDNWEVAKSKTIRIDKNPPVIHFTAPEEGNEVIAGPTVTVNWTATDALSGTAVNELLPSSNSISDSNGQRSFKIIAEDNAGNRITRDINITWTEE